MATTTDSEQREEILATDVEEREEILATDVEEREEIVASTPEALRDQALRRVKKRRDLFAHAWVYLVVNAAVWGIWAVIGANSHSWWPWPVFMSVFWGVGLVMNAWDVYIRRPITEAEVQREIEHLQQRAGGARRAQAKRS